MNGGFSHSWVGVPAFCLPVGLITCVWLEWLVLPMFRTALPQVFGFDPRRWLTTRGLPTRPNDWPWYLAAIALGAATHVLWDGFTHDDSWPATALYGGRTIELFGGRLPVANVLQYASTLFGAVVVAAYAIRSYPPMRTSTRAEVPVGWLRVGLVVMAFIGAAVSVWLHRRDLVGVGWKHVLWVGFWLSVRGIAGGWTVVAVVCAAAQRRAQRDGQPIT